MADCYVSSFSGFSTTNWGGVTMDGSLAIGWSGFDIKSINATTWSGASEATVLSRSGLVWNAAVDASDEIWWTELNFGTGKNELRHCTLAGTGVTLVDADVQCSSQISYDPAHDTFWYVQFGNGIWTISKTGVENQRYANSASVNWQKPSIASDGAAWLVYNTPRLVRVDGGSFANTSITTGFTAAQPFYPGCNDGVITKNGSTVTEYTSGITSTPTGCTLTGVNGGGWPIWNGDLTVQFYTNTTSSGFTAYGFTCVFAEPAMPPLRLHARDDALSVGGARQKLTSSSILASPRVRQGDSYL